jgi:hypothetical protein
MHRRWEHLHGKGGLKAALADGPHTLLLVAQTLSSLCAVVVTERETKANLRNMMAQTSHQRTSPSKIVTVTESVAAPVGPV